MDRPTCIESLACTTALSRRAKSRHRQQVAALSLGAAVSTGRCRSWIAVALSAHQDTAATVWWCCAGTTRGGCCVFRLALSHVGIGPRSRLTRSWSVLPCVRPLIGPEMGCNVSCTAAEPEGCFVCNSVCEKSSGSETVCVSESSTITAIGLAFIGVWAGTLLALSLLLWWRWRKSEARRSELDARVLFWAACLVCSLGVRTLLSFSCRVFVAAKNSPLTWWLFAAGGVELRRAALVQRLHAEHAT